MRIELISALDDEALALAADVWARDERASDPTLAPIGADELRRLACDDRRWGEPHWYLAAVEDGAVSVVAHCEPRGEGPNGHFASVHLLGLDAPEGGRAGLALLAHVLDEILEERHTTIMGWARSAPGPDRFWAGVGLSPAFDSTTSIVDVADIDTALLATWSERAAASGYTLHVWTGACPAEHRASLARVHDAMHDAPSDDLDLEPSVHDAAMVEANDRAWLDLGITPITVLALDEHGAPAGYSRVHVNEHRPSASWQWDTAVVAAARGRGLARRMKATMIRRLRESHPAVTYLRTANAVSNSPMLAINRAMGFRPVHDNVGWQGSVPDVRTALGRGPTRF